MSLSHKAPEVVAVTGAFGFLGRRFLRALADDPNIRAIIAIDIRDAEELLGREGHRVDPKTVAREFPKVSAHQLDLAERNADRTLAEILKSESVDALAHLAFLSNPTHREEFAHEVETIGTMHVLHAAELSNVRRVVMSSSTMVYGAYPDNPTWLTETHPARGMQGSRFVSDKIDAEQQLEKFSRENTDIKCATLRFGPLLGGSLTRNFWTRYFTRRAVATVMGYDPLCQFLYPDDAVEALCHAIKQEHCGTYNVVGLGVLPLSRVLKGIGRINLRVPATVFESAIDGAWRAQLLEMPPTFMRYLRWNWVCDGKLFRETFNYSPKTDLKHLLERVAREFPK